jgi:hypothetical protein
MSTKIPYTNTSTDSDRFKNIPENFPSSGFAPEGASGGRVTQTEGGSTTGAATKRLAFGGTNRRKTPVGTQETTHFFTPPLTGLPTKPLTFSKKIELLFNTDLLKTESCLSKIYFYRGLLDDIITPFGPASLEIKELKELYNLILSEVDSFYLTEIQNNVNEQYKTLAKELLNVHLIELAEKLEQDLSIETSSNPDLVCCICTYRNIHTTIEPCNHTVCCKPCIMQIRRMDNRCPICRGYIKFITDMTGHVGGREAALPSNASRLMAAPEVLPPSTVAPLVLPTGAKRPLAVPKVLP